MVRRFVTNYPDYLIVNADKLTYAGNLENLTDIDKNVNYAFEKTDIVDKQSVLGFFRNITLTELYILLLNRMSTGQ